MIDGCELIEYGLLDADTRPWQMRFVPSCHAERTKPPHPPPATERAPSHLILKGATRYITHAFVSSQTSCGGAQNIFSGAGRDLDFHNIGFPLSHLFNFLSGELTKHLVTFTSEL